MSTYLVHLAVDPTTLPGNADSGYAEVKITPGTYLVPVDTEEQARETFSEYDILLEPNSELRIYRMDQDYDIEAIQGLLDQDIVLTPEEHGATVIEYRAFAGVPRRTDQELSDILDATFEETDPAQEPQPAK